MPDFLPKALGDPSSRLCFFLWGDGSASPQLGHPFGCHPLEGHPFWLLDHPNSSSRPTQPTWSHLALLGNASSYDRSHPFLRSCGSFPALGKASWDEEEEGKTLTSCLLEGIDGLVEAGQGGAVLPRSDLRVQRSEVEEDASLLEGQSPLVGWDPRQGVVPGEGKSQQLSMPWSWSPKCPCHVHTKHPHLWKGRLELDDIEGPFQPKPLHDPHGCRRSLEGFQCSGGLAGTIPIMVHPMGIVFPSPSPN